MDKATAQSAIKKLATEISSLAPSALITLFEIDIENLAIDLGLNLQDGEKIYRFHSVPKLNGTSLFWQSKEFTAAPIEADGFETTSKGTLPTPRIQISCSDDSILALSILKDKLRAMDDLVGAKVTRIRTFAKYLDIENFPDGNFPEGFSPDPNIELPRDIYYIDRKSSENKTTIQFELASLLDIEGIELPNRLCLANKCPFQYRGEGCCYEYNSRRSSVIHKTSALPDRAIPVANDRDELITNVLSISSVREPEPFNSTKVYSKGDSVYITKNEINYYFVAKTSITGKSPPNSNYWLQELCSHTVKGCRIRYGVEGSVVVGTSGLIKGQLPYGGFAGVNRAR
jgi:lambda family phage minor tail protein L